ncbi:CvfB family protein [Chitinophaga sp.]|uniref:CvfB family protein n=1 Tax=Chitinophaga sp. TaxID=1869181 RepID=UPI002D0DAF7C|nr:S1-like domain-containing RNA-binding protein [Chitinophaga sp.]HWV69303.1 S1-like domain-containing RNA-binding protein [Chitinophaga sp.]
MIKVGEYNLLRVKKEADFGVYLEGIDQEILLPARFVPDGTRVGDELEVFLYHDSENRLIATTQRPYGIAGDIVLLKAVSVTNQGAFLDWGLMKDLFVASSQQLTRMAPGQEYLVKIYIDELTGRIAATEKIDRYLSNENLTVKEKDQVNMVVYRRTDIGYVVIINNQHTGILHHSDIFRSIETGEKLTGFIRQIKDNKIDVIAGKPGFNKVEDESGKILRLLQENNGYLPYHDKSSPEEIQDFFGMSKKTFKMTIGNLYKQRKIVFTQTGIKSEEEDI